MMNIKQLLPGFMVHLRDERQLRPQTLTAYKSDLTAFAAFTVGKPFAAVTLDDIRAYMRHMKEKGLRPGTVRRKLHALSTFWELQIIEGRAGVNLARQAQRIAPKRKREVSRKVLSPEQWQAFAHTPAKTLRDAMAWGLLAWLGLRNAELRNLRVDDLDTDGARLLIRGKGGHERALPVPDDLMPGLVALTYQQPPEAYLLRGQAGGLWSKDSFKAAFNQHLMRAGLPQTITPHWLRHTVASHLAGQMTVFELREWLGHESTRTTEVYVHSNGQRLAAAFAGHPLAVESTKP